MLKVLARTFLLNQSQDFDIEDDPQMELPEEWKDECYPEIETCDTDDVDRAVDESTVEESASVEVANDVYEASIAGPLMLLFACAGFMGTP